MKLIVLALLILVSSVSGLSQSSQDKAKIERDILDVMNAQAAAWNRGDVEGYMRGYWNSEKLVFASGDTITRGWQPTLERYKKGYNTREKMGTLKFGEVEVNLISPDAAVVLGSWSLTRAADNPKGKFTLIFRKFAEGWRIVHDHTS